MESYGNIFVEIGLRCVLALIYGILIVLHIEPFKREVPEEQWFYYSYPFVEEESVSNLAIITVVVLLPLVVIPLAAIIYKLDRYSRSVIKNEVIVYLLGYVMACLMTGIFTELGKIWYGQLRPDYLHRCMGRSALLDSYSDIGRVPNCTTSDSKDLQDGRKSWPSGHSSLSACSFGFSALYLSSRIYQCEFKFGNTYNAVPILLLIAPVWVAIGRTCDYRHHPIDVFSGSVLGYAVGIVTFNTHFTKPWKKKFAVVETGYEVNHEVIDPVENMV